MTTYAQTSYRLEGNVFYQEKVIKTKDTLTTSYKISFGDSQEYPIIINKDDGRCYVWRKSQKTGKLYKCYLREDVCLKVCQLTGITYSYKPNPYKR
jgi:hypothetical protein